PLLQLRDSAGLQPASPSRPRVLNPRGTPAVSLCNCGESIPDDAERAVARLILIRHARPVVEPDVPSSRWHLSDEGRADCRPLAARLTPLGASWVFASVEPKAWETGAIVAQRLEVPCSAVAGLHEH